LPAGRRIHAGIGSGAPVACATIEPVPHPGRVWSALSDASADTGLVPFLLASLYEEMSAALDGELLRAFTEAAAGTERLDEAGRPWDNDEFDDKADTGELDHIDPAALLADLWQGQMPSEDEDDELRAERAPFARGFPGRHLPRTTR
jgi:hypothetical protein